MAMIYSIRDFKCTPNILTPGGGAVAFTFAARSIGNPTHLRARYWIDDAEPFVFSPAESANPREVFLPSKDGEIAAPTSRRTIGPKRTVIAPAGAANQAHPQPLKVNLEVTGLKDGEPSETRELDLLITIDTLAMALGLVHTGLGVSKKRIAEILGVSEDTVRKVMGGGSSAMLIDKLRDK